ncbi:hypothetical protein QA601_15330 [Chitinispirillales bacterium ANBcel5]|uniref:hypothetical protein n=1 Tax=Cellulosispirillum alkaliphilum TaxID=3039283 RepID=UPI002A568C60|nr:hypothetical protein [Chitinispirillales bacterium ANBcel5]
MAMDDTLELQSDTTSLENEFFQDNQTNVSPDIFQMTSSEKISSLTNMLNERYNAEHKMRERSTTFTLWILGLGIGLIWGLLVEVQLDTLQKFITSGFILTYSAASFYFVREISKGFCNNRDVIVKIESALGFHSNGFYGNDMTIMPPAYKDKSKDKSKKFKRFSHFQTLYLLLVTSTVFLVFLTILNPVKQRSTAHNNTISNQLKNHPVIQAPNHME